MLYEGCSIKTENNFGKIHIFKTTQYLQPHPSNIHQLLQISLNTLAIHEIRVKISFAPNVWKHFLHRLTPPVEVQNSGPWDLSNLQETGKNHRPRGLGCKNCEESLLHNVRSRNPEHTALHVSTCYCDATSINHYSNMVAYVGYTP